MCSMALLKSGGVQRRMQHARPAEVPGSKVQGRACIWCTVKMHTCEWVSEWVGGGCADGTHLWCLEGAPKLCPEVVTRDKQHVHRPWWRWDRWWRWWRRCRGRRHPLAPRLSTPVRLRRVLPVNPCAWWRCGVERRVGSKCANELAVLDLRAIGSAAHAATVFEAGLELAAARCLRHCDWSTECPVRWVTDPHTGDVIAHRVDA
jgi:hypothetical protein